MWNKHNIFDNDISSKFEDRMFCNFGGGGSSSASEEPSGVTFSGGVVSSDSNDALDAFGGAGDPVGYAGSGYGTFDPNQGDDGGYVAPASNIGVINAAQALASMPTDQLTQLSMPQALEAQNLLEMARNTVPTSVLDLGYVQSRTPNYNMYTQPFNMPQPAQLQQALTDFERNLGLNMMGRAADRQTTVTGMGTQPYGFAPPLGTEGAMTMSSLDQLGRRAGGSGAFEQTPSGYVNDFGTKMAGSMYKDIADKGYIPQYDSRGQIVATINPQTGQYGVGSVASRIDPNNPANIEERMALEGSGVTAPSIAVFSDDDSSVPMGEPMGVGGGVAEAVTPDISMIPTGQIAAGGTPMYRQTMLDVAPTQYGGLLSGQTASDFDAMNRAFRMTGATYPEYFQDPYNLTGYSILT